MTNGVDYGAPPAPRANPHFLGHPEAVRTLGEAFASRRFAHAWLISGPRGVGKATLAYRFARFVLAHGGTAAMDTENLHLDAEHPVFRRVAAGGHADMLTVERGVNEKTGKPRSEIVVGDVRTIGGFFALTAAEGGWRVVVVDSADEMNRHAANAVLKVLEEPPDRALLLLVSHTPGRLLATIRSRCRRLALTALDRPQVVKLVQRYRPGIAGEEAETLAGLADGSIGRALSLAGEGGLDLYRELMGLLETLPELDVPALHALGDRLAKPGAEDAFHTAGELLRRWLGRSIASVAAGDAAPLGVVTAREEALTRRLVGAAVLDRWLEVWEKINHLLGRAGGANLDRKQVVLNVFLALETAARS